MACLTEWRLTPAADLLVRTDATVASIARQVGCRTPFALSSTLKRVHGALRSSGRRPDADKPSTRA